MTREEICREVLEKPLKEIQQDIFFRPDNFQDQPWYGEFRIYLSLGVCRPAPEHALEVQKALRVMGYPTHTAEKDGQLYLLPGEAASRPLKQSSRQKGRER